MRIEQLDLTAFGPFSERNLVFDGAGLQIVHGPNEAGKSSALRALKALLYGIDANTADNFIHPYPKLRIGGRLTRANGDQLVLVRRKGRKGTLLNPAGEVLDEALLKPYLGGVNAQLFQSLFGIDHQALVQGGEEILQQRGEVGQALFAAALGSHTLHSVLAQLDQEADALFRPRGSTQVINAALNSYAELNAAVREGSLNSGEWEAQWRALQRTKAELKAVQGELVQKRSELNRLRRIQRVLPKFARHRELLHELDELGEVVVLDEDFGKRRQRIEHGLQTTRAIIEHALPRQQQLQRQLDKLQVNQSLLDLDERIENLHTRLDGQRKEQRQRPQLVAERQQRMADADHIRQQISPQVGSTELDQLQPLLASRQTLTDLSSRQALLMTELKQAETNLRKTRGRLDLAHKALARIPVSSSATELRGAIAAARKEGDLDRAVRSVELERSELLTSCDDRLARLRLWQGRLQDLAALPLPNLESINRYESVFDELDNNRRRLLERKTEAGIRLQAISLRLDEIERTSQLPSETQLTDARSSRDRVWRIIRSHYIEGEELNTDTDDFQAKGGLPAVFEQRVTAADEISDRLRREADRVAENANLRAKREAEQIELNGIADKLEAIAAERERHDIEWRVLWSASGIVPLSPREMRSWISEFEQLRDSTTHLQALDRKANELGRMRQHHIGLLNRLLQEQSGHKYKPDSLESALLMCEAEAERLDQARIERDQLAREIKSAEGEAVVLNAEHDAAVQALDAWRRQWMEALQRFGLPDEAAPAEVNALIESVRTLFSLQQEIEKLAIRINAIDEESASFHAEAADLANTVALELAALPADEISTRLSTLLKENRSRRDKRQQIEAQIEHAAQEIAESDAVLRSLNEQLDSLCAEAKCASRAELDEVERRSARYLSIKQSLRSIEQQILEAGEGAGLVELQAESAGVDADRLSGEVAGLINLIENELEPQHARLREIKGSTQEKLARMDGSDLAALLAEQAGGELARVRAQSERYMRVKLAACILREQIERYRQQNQGPLVKRAGQHFTALTLGSFQGLLTDFNERDEPVLVGQRPDGGKVDVAGMSSGTRDQLYLALRLASLEKYTQESEPMPFIVDDVLVDFDDQRSKAALERLAALAEKTQVIVFTHHSLVVEQAKQIGQPVQLHQL